MTDQKTQQILTNWKETTLGETGIVITGKTPSKDNPKDWGDCLDFITPTDFVSESKYLSSVDRKLSEDSKERFQRMIIPSGSVIVTCIGSDMGKVVINKNDCLTNQQINSIIVNPDFDRDFIFYSLKYAYPILRIHADGGSTMPILNKSTFEALSLPFPPFPEQRAIASVLSAFDDKIELLREQNKTLEAIAQTLFNRWFVEFNFPDENGQPYLDSGGKMIDSELGEIPEGWRFGKLGDELEVVMGQSPKGETYNTENDGMEFYQGRADFGERFPTIRLFTTDPMKVAEPMDVLLSVRAPVGEINQTLRKCCIGRGLAAIRSNYKSYTFYRLFNEQEKIKLYEDSGTVFGSITKSAIENIEYVVPSQDTVRQFEEKVHILDQKIFNNHFQIQALSQLRDTLLPKLMRGEMRVKGFSD